MAELRVLAWADQQGELQVGGNLSIPARDLVMSLVSNGSLTTFSYERSRDYFGSLGQGSSPSMGSQDGIAGASRLERGLTLARVNALDGLYQNAPFCFQLTHAGRVRLSELKQALRSGREREPMGILWDVRHWEQDLAIALVEASTSNPVCVAYLDMNGLKALNDTHGHDAGDAGLRAYFQAVSAAAGDGGQAYRLGGDEVLVVIQGMDAGRGQPVIEASCRRLMAERLEFNGKRVALSIAAGLVTAVDATKSASEVRHAADQVQYRAKEESRKASPRPSVIALDGVSTLHNIED